MIYEYELDYDSVINVFNGYKYTVETTSGMSTSFTLVADGVINDTQALNELIQEVHNQGGGTIILPSDKEILLGRYDNDPGDPEEGLQSYALNIPSNIHLKSSGGKCTLMTDFTNEPLGANNSTTLFYLAFTSNKENITLENIIFKGDLRTRSLVAVFNGDSMAINNCDFRDFSFSSDSPSISASAISGRGLQGCRIENCSFSKGELAISLRGNNSNVYLEDNFFEDLTNNPIRVAGDVAANEYTDGLWIIGNEINVHRAASYIEDNGIQRLESGIVDFLTEPDPSARRSETGISAINISVDSEASNVHHQNVIVENNIANGSDYGFFDGGSADLFSLKDIERLKCIGNTARNSGDLGFAIERCHFSIISNNTADRNNSSGISIFDSSHTNVVGNMCSNNELARDGFYATYDAYGGIRVERDSYSVLVEGNHFFATSNVRRSETNSISAIGQYSYNEPGEPTQSYGVVVIPKGKRGVDENGEDYVYFVKPSTVKVGTNHAVGMLWGEVYNRMKGTHLVDTYTKFTYPTDVDYPLGARLRNSLISASTASIKEWVVAHRIELQANVNTTSSESMIEVKTVHQNYLDINGNSINNFILQNTDLTTISPETTNYDGDVIGIMLDDYSVHWTTVTDVTDVVVVDAETATCKLTLADSLPANMSGGNIIVSLRWEAL